MSSTYGGGYGSGPPAGEPGQGDGYDAGAYDPGAVGGIPPEAGATGYAGQSGYQADPTYSADSSTSYGGASTYEGGASTYQGQAGTGYDTSGGASAVTPDRPDVEDESVGSLVGRLTGDLSKLMRQELDLAKAELREEAKKAGKAAGMLAAAGLAGLMVLIFLSLTLMWLLDKIMYTWLAALIVTLLWAIVGGVLFMMGRKQLAEVNPKPEQTVQSLKEDKEWVQAQKN